MALSLRPRLAAGVAGPGQLVELQAGDLGITSMCVYRNIYIYIYIYIHAYIHTCMHAYIIQCVPGRYGVAAFPRGQTHR